MLLHLSTHQQIKGLIGPPKFDITPQGRVADVRVVEKNVPNEQVRMLRQRVRGARYRPSIEEGQVITSQDLRYRQTYQVIIQPGYEEPDSGDS